MRWTTASQSVLLLLVTQRQPIALLWTHGLLESDAGTLQVANREACLVTQCRVCADPVSVLSQYMQDDMQNLLLCDPPIITCGDVGQQTQGVTQLVSHDQGLELNQAQQQRVRHKVELPAKQCEDST